MGKTGVKTWLGVQFFECPAVATAGRAKYHACLPSFVPSCLYLRSLQLTTVARDPTMPLLRFFGSPLRGRDPGGCVMFKGGERRE